MNCLICNLPLKETYAGAFECSDKEDHECFIDKSVSKIETISLSIKDNNYWYGIMLDHSLDGSTIVWSDVMPISAPAFAAAPVAYYQDFHLEYLVELESYDRDYVLNKIQNIFLLK